MSIVIIVIISYFRSSSLRERQQIRVFVGGTILAFAPFLLLTVIPQALGGSQLYGVDPQFTTLPFVLFPLALGYSVLRYQILVFDVHIRRGVAIATGIIGLVLLTYLSVTLGSIIFGSQTSLYVVCVAGVTVVLAPMVWRLGKTITERLFFSEIAYYQRLLETPTGLNEVTLDLAEAAQLIMIASSQAFDTHETCLFVVDEDTGYFRTCPNLKYDGNDVHRHTLLRRLLLPLDAEAFEDGASIVKMPRRAVQQIARAKRPLLLHEITKDGEEPPTGLARFLNTAEPADTANTMVVPVRTQGKMIAILVVGVRGDRQQYGGPDFEIAQIILSRFSPVLETARLYARANRHGALLNNLYRVSAISGNAFQTMEEVAAAYTHVATEAVATHAEIWLHDRQYQTLWHIAPDGRRSHIARDECLYITNGRDWSPWFYEGNTILEWQDNSTQVPSCLRQTPPFPFAWLPLNKGEEHMGVLVLVYPRPHTFLKEEIRVLQMFASQCAAALENTRITIELRAANERQKELDRLKDQFIVTASHELRTPLTAVQGYIELLKEYDHTLPIDMRAEFIAKAGRGCEELTLMVENIMDASRVRVDAENVRLSAFSLQPSFEYVLGILEALMKREGRAVTLAIVPELQVVADEKRLRQVMLNLLSNALKYSPAGTAIEISAEQADNQVVVRIRDYGAGITSEEQQRLFERFMRLERDINSPTRGAGLGLYICKQLVEAMRGQIWIESSGVMGEGSVFAFTLPTTLPLSYEKKRYRQTQPVEDGDKVRTR